MKWAARFIAERPGSPTPDRGASVSWNDDGQTHGDGQTRPRIRCWRVASCYALWFCEAEFSPSAWGECHRCGSFGGLASSCSACHQGETRVREPSGCDAVRRDRRPPSVLEANCILTCVNGSAFISTRSRSLGMRPSFLSRSLVF